MKSFINAVGFLLGALGVGALLWSGYILLFVSDQQKLLEILPAKNIAFFATSNSSQPYHIPLLGVSLRENSSVVVYFDQSETSLLSVSVFPLDSQESFPAACEQSKGFVFCLEQGSKSEFYTFLDDIENRVPPMSKSDLIFKTDFNLDALPDVSVSYVGTNAFINDITNGALLPFISEDNLQKMMTLYSASENFFPYFSGTITISNTEDLYTFFLHKSELKSLFPQSISQYSFLPQFFPSDITKYVYIKQPSFLWENLQEIFSQTQWVGVQEVQQWGRSNIVRMFDNQANFSRDISPLLHNDIILAENRIGEAMALSSFPSRELAEEFGDNFSSLLEKISTQKTPIKKGHELNDGTFLYEVFPDESVVVEKKQSSSKGEMVFYENSHSSLKKTFTPGIVQKDSFLMLATDASFLTHFWEPTEEFTNFAMPSRENVIFAYGIKPDEKENASFSFLEIAAEENEKNISFVAKVSK